MNLSKNTRTKDYMDCSSLTLVMVHRICTAVQCNANVINFCCKSLEPIIFPVEIKLLEPNAIGCSAAREQLHEDRTLRSIVPSLQNKEFEGQPFNLHRSM